MKYCYSLPSGGSHNIPLKLVVVVVAVVVPITKDNSTGTRTLSWILGGMSWRRIWYTIRMNQVRDTSMVKSLPYMINWKWFVPPLRNCSIRRWDIPPRSTSRTPRNRTMYTMRYRRLPHSISHVGLVPWNKMPWVYDNAVPCVPPRCWQIPNSDTSIVRNLYHVYKKLVWSIVPTATTTTILRWTATTAKSCYPTMMLRYVYRNSTSTKIFRSMTQIPIVIVIRQPATRTIVCWPRILWNLSCTILTVMIWIYYSRHWTGRQCIVSRVKWIILAIRMWYYCIVDDLRLGPRTH